jgi:uncharacterized Zn-binding protein involved in type VI secretion
MAGETFAARLMDLSVCSSHGAVGMILASGYNVFINKMFAAKAGDMSLSTNPLCPIDYIVTGAAQVLINTKPAARTLSKMMHGGIVVGMSPDVLIGGDSAGVTLGNPDAAQRMCEKAATSRDPTNGRPMQQSYAQNCGCESARMLLNQANGTNVGEQKFLGCTQINKQSTGKNDDQGRTTTDQRSKLLDNEQSPPCVPGQGLPNSQVPQTQNGQMSPEMQQAVANGQGVIAASDVDGLDGKTPVDKGHSVIVSGLQYDANGNLVAVNIVDTGTGNCNRVVGAQTFANSLNKNAGANVTNKPVY